MESRQVLFRSMDKKAAATGATGNGIVPYIVSGPLSRSDAGVG